MEMDEDGSGEVDFDEFEAWFLSRDERYAQRLSTIVGKSQSCMVSNVGKQRSSTPARRRKGRDAMRCWRVCRVRV